MSRQARPDFIGEQEVREFLAGIYPNDPPGVLTHRAKRFCRSFLKWRERKTLPIVMVCPNNHTLGVCRCPEFGCKNIYTGEWAYHRTVGYAVRWRISLHSLLCLSPQDIDRIQPETARKLHLFVAYLKATYK